MSKNEQVQGGFPVPWGIRLALAISGLFGLGVMFLTTINHTFRESFYAGIGVFTISMAVTLGIWTVNKIAREQNW